MGTETRIGITAGLLIVIAASVYFFYGSDRAEDDLSISIGTPASTAARIPPTGDARSARPRETVKRATVDRSRTKAKPVPPMPKRKTARTDRPRSTRKNAVMPPRRNGETLARADQPARSRLTPPAVRPPIGRRTAEDRTPSSPAPRQPQTHLRSGPSTGLIDATRKNLRPGGTAGGKTDQKPTVTPKAPATGSSSRPQERSASDAADRSKASGRKDRTVLRDRSVSPRRPSSIDPRKSADTSKSEQVQPVLKRSTTTVSQKDQWPKRHRVSFDETLSGISLRYYDTSTRVDQILKANPRVRDPRRLKPGEVLVIPAPVESGSSSPGASTRLAIVETGSSGRVYLVQRGDSFYSIARKMLGDGARWQELLDRNRAMVKNDPKRLRPGMRIILPEANSEKSKSQKAKKSK